MDIYIDIETLRAPEETRLEMLEDVKTNFKAPSKLTKTQAAIDLGLSDPKFMVKEIVIEQWEKEFAESKSADVAKEKWEKKQALTLMLRR